MGWDIGGAHLKAARCRDGVVTAVRQLPCALWQGLDRLDAAMAEALAAGAPAAHALTMTGELADLFPDRGAGVRAILGVARRILDSGVAVYAADGRFRTIDAALAAPLDVASANWHATARLAAARLGDGLLVDIGTTTSDLVPFGAGRVLAQGGGDAKRLASGELAYQGVARTPVMAVARHVFFGGARRGVMAELFATMADVHRLAGGLPEDADQHPAADGRGKSPAESRARLARMVGCDAAMQPDAAWDDLARQLARRQLRHLEAAAEQVLSQSALPPQAPLVAAGAGSFLVPALAQRLGRPCRPFARLLAAPPDLAWLVETCAPAVAVALLYEAADAGR
jgi:probable H4MPT-linked C1 transfer pathway protein